MSEINTVKQKNALIVGIIGCVLFVIGDFLYAAVDSKQSSETIGIMIRVAYLDMSVWRMAASIICGIVGTVLYYVGFQEMYQLLKIYICEPKEQKWVKGFRIAYLTGTVCWGYVHSMFMNTALIFKFVFEKYGDIQAAADIANKVFYCNAAPMLAAFIIGDGILSTVMIVMVWKRIIPLKSIGARIFATLCNPIACAGIVGNLMTLLPWPMNQLDVGSESAGHALVLVLGLVLLKKMSNNGGVR